mgnify:CR=1 FL=1|jgi:hypothetical protein
MKITRRQLKRIINEELEIQALKENMVSDIVDVIVDKGEDAHSWIKKNMRDVTKAAKSIGSDVDSVVTDIVMAVDQTLGTEMSRSTRIQKSLNKWEEDNNAKQAASDAATAERNTPEAIAARVADAEYEAEMEKWREAGARVKAAERERNTPKPEALDVYTPGGVNSDPWNNKHRVNPGLAGSGNMGYGEGIEMSDTGQLIKEETNSNKTLINEEWLKIAGIIK